MNFQARIDDSLSNSGSAGRTHLLWTVAEVLLIVGIFWAYGGQPAPDVNETHYLTKAKQFWNPQWCEGDLFLSSSNPHLLFYWMFGWLTLFMPLAAVAMVGRIVTWTLMAFAWHRLSKSVFPTRMISVLTAAIWLLLLDRCHMAGEWVVGGFEAKGLSYVFVIGGLAAMLRERWGHVWICVGIASAFHVVVGGWSCVCFAVVCLTLWIKQKWFEPQKLVTLPSDSIEGRDSLASTLTCLLIGGLISLVGLLPPLLSTLGTASETIHLANEINVTRRLRHHQLFEAFGSYRVGMFCALVFLWIMGQRFVTLVTHRNVEGGSNVAYGGQSGSRCRTLNLFTIGTLGICVCGVLLSGISNTNTPAGETAVDLLIYYWFRLSDFAVPMAASFVFAVLLQRSWCCLTGKAFATSVVIGLIAMLSIVCVNRWSDPRPIADRRALPKYPAFPDRTLRTYENWKRACQWVRENTPEDSVFLTPARQQTFKWYAQRREVVNWKDSPQDAIGLVEWLTRIQRFQRPQFSYQGGLWAYSDQQLRDIAKEYGVTHIMTLQADFESRVESGSTFRQVYPGSPKTRATYVVFKID